jgi:hypothetical protein
MRSAKSTGTPADPSASALITLRRHLQLHLRPSLARLRCGADPLDAEIERIEAFIDALDGKAASEPSVAREAPHLVAVA